MLGFYDDIQKVKEDYLNRVVEETYRYSNIVIYGAGRVATPIYKKLTDNNIDIFCFAVTDKTINEAEFFEKKVIEINDLELHREDTLFIIAVKYVWAGDVLEKLQERGYSHYIFPPKEIDYFAREQSDWVYRPVMEVTTRIGCKINCRYCPQDLFVKTYCSQGEREMILTLDNYKKCLMKLPKNTIIDFCGFTEPFLNSETVDMISYTHQQGYDLKLHTTLVGLTKDDFKRICDIPFLYVVLHTPDENCYANIPMTDEYFEILEMALNQKKPDGSNFINTANCQGVPHRDVLKHTQGKLRIMSQLYDRAGNIKDEEMFQPIDKLPGKIYCARVNKKLDYNELLPDGTVVLCNFDFGLKHVLGNLLYDSYEEIMNGPKMQTIVNALDDDNCDLLCRTCNYAVKGK